jgi:hypothetical protein
MAERVGFEAAFKYMKNRELILSGLLECAFLCLDVRLPIPPWLVRGLGRYVSFIQILPCAEVNVVAEAGERDLVVSRNVKAKSAET